MSLPIHALIQYYGPIGVNITTLAVSLIVFGIAAFLKLRHKQTPLFEWALLVLLLAFVFQTFHGIIIQRVFPISLPEQPLYDNYLTLNYTLTNIIAYTVVPILAVLAISKPHTVGNLGFKVNNWKQTAVYTGAGLVFACAVYLTTELFFHQQWVQGYTQDGMILWIILVSIISVILQTVFFFGILFNRFIGKQNAILLAVITFLAFQSYLSANALPIQIAGLLGFSTKLYVTWKTRNIYSACIIAVAISLMEITLQLI